jgi:hypothetical protein
LVISTFVSYFISSFAGGLGERTTFWAFTGFLVCLGVAVGTGLLTKWDLFVVIYTPPYASGLITTVLIVLIRRLKASGVSSSHHCLGTMRKLAGGPPNPAYN